MAGQFTPLEMRPYDQGLWKAHGILKSDHGKIQEKWAKHWRYLSNDQEIQEAPGCLGFIGDEILKSYIGIVISQYENPF